MTLKQLNTEIYKYFILDLLVTYVIENNLYCTNELTVDGDLFVYNSLTAATDICDRDIACTSVHDYGCGQANKYGLCYRTSSIHNSTLGTCLHIKGIGIMYRQRNL